MFALSHRCLLFFLAAIFVTLQAPVARAEDRETADRGADQQDGPQFGLGVGASFKRSPYKGIDNDNVYLPLVSYEGRYVRLFGNVLDVKLPPVGMFDFSIRGKVGLGEGYKASKSAYLSGMASRNGSIYLGGATTMHAGFADLSVDYLKDVSGNSKGSQLKLGIERSFIFERRYQLTPHASVTRLDAKYVDYYFGVKPSEATTERPQYLGKPTTDTEIGVRFVSLITLQQRLILDVTDTHWGSGVADSPLVDRKTTPGALLGYIYSFR